MIKAGEERVGEFWLPDTPATVARGLLRIDDSGGPSVQLLGALRQRTEREGEFPVDQEHSEILGETSDGPVSLWNCWLNGSSPGSTGLVDRFRDDPVFSQRFDAYRVLIGGRHFPDPDEACIREISLELTYFRDWAHGVLTDDVDGSEFRHRVRLGGCTLSLMGSTWPATRSRGRRDAYGLGFKLAAPTSIGDFYFKWQRPFVQYLEVAVGEEVRTEHETILLPSRKDPGGRTSEVFTRGTLPTAEQRDRIAWGRYMRLTDGKIHSRLRRWYEIDRLAVHGLSNLGMLHAENNRWSNNRLMNAAAACESLQRALNPNLPDDPTVKQRRRRIARQIADREDRDWFYRQTERVGQPGFEQRMRDFAAPIAELMEAKGFDCSDWAKQLRARGTTSRTRTTSTSTRPNSNGSRA